MPASAGSTRAKANHPSDSRIPPRPSFGAATRSAIRSGIVDRAGSALTDHRSRNPGGSALSVSAYASDFWSAARSLRPFGTVMVPRIMFCTVATALVSYSPYHGSL